MEGTWEGLSKFTLKTSTGETATIFATGLQMTPVYVHLVPRDSDGNKITVNDAMTALAYQNTTLVDYETEKPLIRVDSIDVDHRVPSDDWYFCTTPNDFVVSGSERADKKEQTDITLTFYVACKNRSTTSKRIGASILLPGGTDPIMDTDYGDDGFTSSVLITANEAPYSSATSAVFATSAMVSVEAYSLPHSGQYNDDGTSTVSANYRGPDENNLWRQNNFIIRPLRNGEQAKVVKIFMHDSANNAVNFDNSGCYRYSSSTFNGYNTQCYILKPGADNSKPVTLQWGLNITLNEVSRPDAVCITWLTQYFPIANWDSEITTPVSVELIDENSISYIFTTTPPGRISYSSILDIVKNSPNNPDLLFSWDNRSAGNPINSQPTKVKYFHLFETGKKQYIRYDSDHHHYCIEKDPDHLDRGVWYLSEDHDTDQYTYPLAYKMNLRATSNSDNKKRTPPKTKSSFATDYLTHEGDIDIYTASADQLANSGPRLLIIMLNPIWSTKDGQFQILGQSYIDGERGWVRCDNDFPPKMRLAFSPARLPSTWVLYPVS